VRVSELAEDLQGMDGHLSMRVYEDTRTVEIQETAISKARAVSRWLSRRHYDFILAAGDDSSDEDVFAMLPEDCCTVRVGGGHSLARFVVDDADGLRDLLRELVSSHS
jgi:trehalose 6-phosphate synthase/phosphatase